MTVVLSDMTLNSLLDISKIPCDSNETYENKIKLLKNANILLKDENYSNNMESLHHQELTNKDLGGSTNNFIHLLQFFQPAHQKDVTIYFFPNNKNKEGLNLQCINTIEIKYDFETNEPIALNHNISLKNSPATPFLVTTYDANGNYMLSSIDKTFFVGTWQFLNNLQLTSVGTGFSEYNGKLIYTKYETNKTLKGKYYIQNYTKTKRTDEYKNTGFLYIA